MRNKLKINTRYGLKDLLYSLSAFSSFYIRPQQEIKIPSTFFERFLEREQTRLNLAGVTFQDQ